MNGFTFVVITGALEKIQVLALLTLSNLEVLNAQTFASYDGLCAPACAMINPRALRIVPNQSFSFLTASMFTSHDLCSGTASFRHDGNVTMPVVNWCCIRFSVSLDHRVAAQLTLTQELTRGLHPSPFTSESQTCPALQRPPTVFSPPFKVSYSSRTGCDTRCGPPISNEPTHSPEYHVYFCCDTPIPTI